MKRNLPSSNLLSWFCIADNLENLFENNQEVKSKLKVYNNGKFILFYHLPTYISGRIKTKQSLMLRYHLRCRAKNSLLRHTAERFATPGFQEVFR